MASRPRWPRCSDPDGTWQVTADGHPLYTYRGDHAAGQTKGQRVMDTGGTWYALSASGTPVTSGRRQ